MILLSEMSNISTAVNTPKFVPSFWGSDMSRQGDTIAALYQAAFLSSPTCTDTEKHRGPPHVIREAVALSPVACRGKGHVTVNFETSEHLEYVFFCKNDEKANTERSVIYRVRFF